MFYIYSRNIETGYEQFEDTKNTWKEVIEKLSALYELQSKSVMFRNKYYFFVKER